jgi:hypothetical protein
MIIENLEQVTQAVLDEMKMERKLLESIESSPDEELFQASMGIYVFNRQVLVDCLSSDLDDFGKHVIPKAIGERQVNAYIFRGYWEDIGTIRAFYDANLDLTNLEPQYSFFEAQAPIYTHPRFLPGSKINGTTLRQAIISDGCIISDAHIERSVIGVRSIIRSGATIRNSVIMGGIAYLFNAQLGQTAAVISLANSSSRHASGATRQGRRARTRNPRRSIMPIDNASPVPQVPQPSDRRLCPSPNRLSIHALRAGDGAAGRAPPGASRVSPIRDAGRRTCSRGSRVARRATSASYASAKVSGSEPPASLR